MPTEPCRAPNQNGAPHSVAASSSEPSHRAQPDDGTRHPRCRSRAAIFHSSAHFHLSGGLAPSAGHGRPWRSGAARRRFPMAPWFWLSTIHKNQKVLLLSVRGRRGDRAKWIADAARAMCYLAANRPWIAFLWRLEWSPLQLPRPVPFHSAPGLFSRNLAGLRLRLPSSSSTLDGEGFRRGTHFSTQGPSRRYANSVPCSRARPWESGTLLLGEK